VAKREFLRLPVLDAAIFASFDGGGWDEENIVC